MTTHHRKARHTQSIPDPAIHPVKYRLLQARWRLAVAAVVYPVQVALAISLVICAIPVYLVIDSQSTLKRQGEQIRGLVGRIQSSRVKTAGDICRILDRNTRITNAQLTLYQNLIVGGAKQSRAFDKLYRQYGAPRYATRVRQAEALARKIEKLRLPLPNCNAAILSIKINEPPPRPPAVHGNP